METDLAGFARQGATHHPGKAIAHSAVVLAAPEARQRRRARSEDRIRDAKDTGADRLAWLARLAPTQPPDHHDG